MSLFDGVKAIFNTPPATPAQAGQVSGGVEQPGIADQWRSWLKKPENAAALMQTGISLMQPMSLGQNTLGAIGSSIGQGMEARDRVIQNQNDQQQTQIANEQNAQKMKNENTRVANETVSTNADTEYKKNLGLSVILNAKKVKAGKAEKGPLTWQQFYDQEVKTVGAMLDTTSPEFMTKVQSDWKNRNAPPEGTSVPVSPATGAVNSALDINTNPMLTTLQSQIDAAKVKGIPTEQIIKALRTDGHEALLLQLKF